MIDLRSDTVTVPCSGMLDAMTTAEVGDDVYIEDPTVKLLEEKVCELFGKAAAIYAPSGTQSNLLALLAHCGRGDEYIVGAQAHTYKFEGGGAAVLGSIQPQPVAHTISGSLDCVQVGRAIKNPDDVHYAKTRLVCLENTHNGQVIDQNDVLATAKIATEHHLKLHLDGARICNAAVKQNQTLAELCQPFDSVSVCLSKGLGAPIGSVLCADAQTIHEARRWRKMLGGGMRQVGYMAATGLYALKHNIARLAEDHDNAEALAKDLSTIEEIQVDYTALQTNMVFVYPGTGNNQQDCSAIPGHLADRGILLGRQFDWHNDGRSGFRLVTHKNISAADIKNVVGAFKDFFTTP